MTTTTRRVAALLGAITVTIGAAACSPNSTTPAATTAATSTASPTTSAPTASAIVEKAKANALSARSGAFSGEVTQDGQKMKIDFKGTKDGSTSDITIDMGAKGTVRLISVDGNVYMQADAAFWKDQGAPAEVQQAGDKFIQAPAAEAGLAKELTIATFLQEAFTELTPDKISDTVGSESVDGVDCWVVTDKKGKQEGALYVAKDSMTLVRFTGSTASPGQIDFSSWNEDLGITAPPKEQILQLN